jgi:hypothetical protein
VTLRACLGGSAQDGHLTFAVTLANGEVAPIGAIDLPAI